MYFSVSVVPLRTMEKKVTFKEINKLAIPAVFAGIVEPLISITDTAVAGRLEVNTVASMAGVGLAGAFLSTLVWIFAQTKSAISAYVSQSYGAGKVLEIRPLFSQIFWLNLGIGILVLLGSLFLAREIFQLYSATGLVLDYTVEYFIIRVWGFPLTLLTFTIFGAFRGLQNTSWAMMISIIGGVTNMILDYWFAIVLDMHIVGIAYASLVSQVLMFVLAVIYLLWKTPFRLEVKRKLHSKIYEAFRMTLDLIARTASLNIALFLANRYATSYGGEYIDTQSVLMQIWLLSAFILDGYSNAGNAISGRLLGANNFKSLWQLSIDLSKSMLVMTSFLMLFYVMGYKYIGHWFAPNQIAIISLFEKVFWVVIIMQPINAIAFLFDGIYKGLGEARFLRNILLLATFVGFIPTLLILDALEFRMYAIWFAFFVWMLIRSGGLVIAFRKKYKSISR